MTTAGVVALGLGAVVGAARRASSSGSDRRGNDHLDDRGDHRDPGPVSPRRPQPIAAAPQPVPPAVARPLPAPAVPAPPAVAPSAPTPAPVLPAPPAVVSPGPAPAIPAPPTVAPPASAPVLPAPPASASPAPAPALPAPPAATVPAPAPASTAPRTVAPRPPPADAPDADPSPRRRRRARRRDDRRHVMAAAALVVTGLGGLAGSVRLATAEAAPIGPELPLHVALPPADAAAAGGAGRAADDVAPADAGLRADDEAPARAAARPSPPSPARPAVDPAPATLPVAPTSSPTAAATPLPGPAPAARPTAVEIPGLDVHSELMELGLDDERRLEVPADPGVAGWYAGGPRPGDLGAAVVVGHVDSTAGPGVFWRLRELRPGDRVVVHGADGSSLEFVVERLEQWPKDDFPTERVYQDADGAELRLVTCGGSFDDGTGHYRDNIIAFATLVAS